MRREWIEISCEQDELKETFKSPSMRREWIEMVCYGEHCPGGFCLPPCGGSGLKLHSYHKAITYQMSPSMRREWIEIKMLPQIHYPQNVSLHAEGVD